MISIQRPRPQHPRLQRRRAFLAALAALMFLVLPSGNAEALPYMELVGSPTLLGPTDDYPGMYEYIYDVYHAENFHEYLITLQGFEADAIVNLHDLEGDAYGPALYQMWDSHTAGGWPLWAGSWEKAIRPSYYKNGAPGGGGKFNQWLLPSEGACVGCVNEAYELYNDWHSPFAYDERIFYSTRPGELLDLDGGIAGNDAIRWTPFGSGSQLFSVGGLGMTFRVVHPNAPGSIQYHFYGSGQSSLGTLTGPAPIAAPPCIIGDADCDGYIDISGDILPAFTNFTGPCTDGVDCVGDPSHIPPPLGPYNKHRADGDVHSTSTGATVNLDQHDGDVDVSDLLTMFGNFTGPAPDNGAPDGSGLVAAEAGDANIPDLIYNALTGEVTLDIDGSGIIGYVLKNGDNSFAFGNHLQILAGVKTSVAGELSEAAFASSVGANSIGDVFPTGMNLAALTAYLTVNDVSRSLGAPVVPFDLVVLSTGPAVPEPATVLLSVFGLLGMGLIAYRRRRLA